MFKAMRGFRNVVLSFATCLILFGAAVPSVSAQPPAPTFTAEQQQQLDVAKMLSQQSRSCL